MRDRRIYLNFRDSNEKQFWKENKVRRALEVILGT